MPVMTFERFHPLDAGAYCFLVKDCKIATNKTNNQDFYSWSFEVLSEGEFQGKVISFATPMQYGPGSAAYRFLRAAGMPELSEKATIDTDDYIGQEFYAEVTVEKNKTSGEDVNKYKSFWTVEDFTAMLEKASKGAKKVTPQSTPKGGVTGTVPTKVSSPVSPGKVTASTKVGPTRVAPKSVQVETVAEEGDGDLNFPKE